VYGDGKMDPPPVLGVGGGAVNLTAASPQEKEITRLHLKLM